MTVPERLIERVLGGDRDAWREFQASIEPTIVALARKHRSLRTRGLAKLPDDVREVAVASLERLAREDFQNLRHFINYSGSDEDRAQALTNWLRNAVDYVVREHIRKRYGRAPKPSEGDARPPQLARRDVHTLADRLEDPRHAAALLRSVGMTNQLTVAEIFAFIDRTFEVGEARAIRMHFLQDRPLLEIANVLGLPDEAAADRLIRALTARLRHQFAKKTRKID